MTDQKTPVKTFLANRIKEVIVRKSKGIASVQLELIAEIQAVTGNKNKVTMWLNNTAQPSLPEFADVAQVLEVDNIWDLIQLQNNAG